MAFAPARARIILLLSAAPLLSCGDSPVPTPQRPALTRIDDARFYLVGPAGADVSGTQTRKLGPGFGVMILDELMLGAERMGRTPDGGLLPLRALRPVQPSTFTGVTVERGVLDFGWTGPDEAYVWAQPERRGRPAGLLRRHERVSLRDEPAPANWRAVRGGFVEAAALRVPRRMPRPIEIARDEAWLDVELASQTLVAYVGDEPRFATLVSTGLGRRGTTFATPLGLHRIVSKLLTATMDNLEHEGVTPYSYADVPYTQYIGRVALHGAFWHDRFGVPVSHGCINVSVADAQRLFEFTSPRLPQGETRVLPRPDKPATAIRIR